MNQAYHGVTTLHQLGLASLIVIVVAILVLRREDAVLPLLIMAVFVPSAQRIVFGGMDFTLLRITVLAGLARIVLRREAIHFQITALDKALMLWGGAAVITYTLQQRSIMGLANRVGYMIDTLGVYFFIRCVVRGPEDVVRVFRRLVLIAVPVLVLFVVERTTGRNFFSVLGGVPEITRIREGRLRVQGAFAHPILAGSFWAAVMPVVVYRWWIPEERRVPIVLATGMLGALIWLSASSTPVLGALVGVLMLPAIRYRHAIKWVPLAAVTMYIGLDMAMNAPVWHLVSRIDVSGGSTGWHRFFLIDQTIRNFREWAIVGTPSITHWGVWADDVTNQYVLEAIRGGLPTLVAYIGVIVVAVTTAKKVTDQYVEVGDDSTARLAWALGAMVVVHAVNFIAVSYFGEIIALQYIGLAMIGVLAHRVRIPGEDSQMSGRGIASESALELEKLN